ncbi:hypothetical protein H6P81_006426 [Aristolochia fimbriata]|uniref:Differentiation-associated protein 1 n=1 Tax=Aristolochia fimbriata TaxID=158543 RepID=A0AAV7F0R5_ARIFI|nr:hypothetical protein H6P81_006426 [Aristolochia fimbriata]
MSLTLNLAAGFSSPVKLQHVSKSVVGENNRVTWGIGLKSLSFRLSRSSMELKWNILPSASDNNNIATNSKDVDLEGSEEALSHKESSKSMQMPVNSSDMSTTDGGTGVPSSNEQPIPKKSPLTARERLKAARVLSRYADSKPSKSEMGSKVLDALRETEKGKKRSGLPEAPSNLFDDSKRGLPKPGLTFDFPGGNDLLPIIFSFVFISSVMFATTYVVWKAGAIHFNEY